MSEALLSPQDLLIGRKALEMALEKGVSKARICLSKSVMDLVGTLNGKVDKVTKCIDKSLSVNLFCDSRYGSFSTNRLDLEGIDAFLDKAIETTRMLTPDPLRDLPEPSLTAKDALTGFELDLYDPEYEAMTPELRLELALGASIFESAAPEGCKLVSEEAEYSDSIFDNWTIDSNGLECRHIETAFEYGVEMTVEDTKGNKYSKYWWDGTPRLKDLDINGCCPKALEKAASMTGPRRVRSGKKTMVIDSEVASKVASPILRALNAYSLQQNNSFLLDSMGKRLFSEGLTIIDECRRPGKAGSRLFDSEGVASSEVPIIEKGEVKRYFVNTYMAAKTGYEQTVEDALRPRVLPFPEEGLDRDEIIRRCGEGILITDFNGGNSNTSTGAFSYGIEGYAFKNGRITHPVHDMVVTGNFLDLWSGLLYCGSDARECQSKLVPTLAFANVDFSA